MKRLLSAALALSLLSGTAAYADPFGHGPRPYPSRFDRGYRHHDDGAGTAIAVGVGLLALTAILAASDHDRAPARDAAYYPPPPPADRDNGYDNRGYGPNDYRNDERYDDNRYDDRGPGNGQYPDDDYGPNR